MISIWLICSNRNLIVFQTDSTYSHSILSTIDSIYSFNSIPTIYDLTIISNYLIIIVYISILSESNLFDSSILFWFLEDPLSTLERYLIWLPLFDSVSRIPIGSDHYL